MLAFYRRYITIQFVRVKNPWGSTHPIYSINQGGSVRRKLVDSIDLNTYQTHQQKTFGELTETIRPDTAGDNTCEMLLDDFCRFYYEVIVMPSDVNTLQKATILCIEMIIEKLLMSPVIQSLEVSDAVRQCLQNASSDTKASSRNTHLLETLQKLRVVIEAMMCHPRLLQFKQELAALSNTLNCFKILLAQMRIKPDVETDTFANESGGEDGACGKDGSEIEAETTSTSDGSTSTHIEVADLNSTDPLARLLNDLQTFQHSLDSGLSNLVHHDVESPTALVSTRHLLWHSNAPLPRFPEWDAKPSQFNR